jgi:hypothetical protein
MDIKWIITLPIAIIAILIVFPIVAAYDIVSYWVTGKVSKFDVVYALEFADKLLK